jgi:hypothetical protein
MDFFSGYVKDTKCVPPLPRDPKQLQKVSPPLLPKMIAAEKLWAEER